MFAVSATYHTTLQASLMQLVFGRDVILNIKHVDDVRHIKCTDDVSDSLMDAFDDRIGLRVPSCYRFPF